MKRQVYRTTEYDALKNAYEANNLDLCQNIRSLLKDNCKKVTELPYISNFITPNNKKVQVSFNSKARNDNQSKEKQNFLKLYVISSSKTKRNKEDISISSLKEMGQQAKIKFTNEQLITQIKTRFLELNKTKRKLELVVDSARDIQIILNAKQTKSLIQSSKIISQSIASNDFYTFKNMIITLFGEQEAKVFINQICYVKYQKGNDNYIVFDVSENYFIKKLVTATLSYVKFREDSII